MFKKIIFTIVCYFFAGSVFAADPPPLIGGGVLPGSGHEELEYVNEGKTLTWLNEIFLNRTINIAIAIGAGLAVVFLIFGAYQYLTALGDSDQIGQAHKTITFSLVGLAVALLAFAIVQIIVGLDFDARGNSAVKEINLTE